MYLSQVRAKGKIYVYLSMYCGEQELTSKREKNVYAFGEIEDALYKMYYWQMHPNMIPTDLIELGCKLENIKNWISKLEKIIDKRAIY